MKKGDETRQRIIEQTSGLFNSKGYYATTLSEVMEATGLKKGGIYNHFSSKEELALEVFNYNTGLLGREISAALARHTSCKRKLSELIALGTKVSKGFPVPGGCPILNAGIESDGYYPPLKEACGMALKGLKRSILSVLEEGIDTGEFKNDINAEELTDFFISSFEGGMFLTRMEESDKPMQAVLSTLNVFLESICAS